MSTLVHYDFERHCDYSHCCSITYTICYFVQMSQDFTSRESVDRGVNGSCTYQRHPQGHDRDITLGRGCVLTSYNIKILLTSYNIIILACGIPVEPQDFFDHRQSLTNDQR